MRTAGWICMVLGGLSLIGALSKGDSGFGPLFLIGLGAFFLYRVNEKESEKKTIAVNQYPKKKVQVTESITNSVPKTNQNDTPKYPNQQLERLEDIQAQLTFQQREAAMCLISFFGGYNDNMMDDAPIMLFKQSAVFFGIPDSPIALSKIMSKYTDADTLVDIVLTIKPIKAKEFLLLTCYDLIKSSSKSEGFELLFNIANDMGYDSGKLKNLINRYQ